MLNKNKKDIKNNVQVCRNLQMLFDKFGIKVTPKQARIYNEAFLHDVEAMEDYLNAMASGSSMTGRVAELALFIDSLDKRYNKI